MDFGFYYILSVTRVLQDLEELVNIILKPAVYSWCLQSEKINQPLSSWEDSSLVLWNSPLLPLCFYFKDSTPASGKDLFRRHWDCHTLEWIHGGGCGSWGESSPRGRAWCYCLWGKRQLMVLTSRSKMCEILEVNSPVISIWRPMKYNFNSSLR